MQQWQWAWLGNCHSFHNYTCKAVTHYTALTQLCHHPCKDPHRAERYYTLHVHCAWHCTCTACVHPPPLDAHAGTSLHNAQRIDVKRRTSFLHHSAPKRSIWKDLWCEIQGNQMGGGGNKGGTAEPFPVLGMCRKAAHTRCAHKMPQKLWHWAVHCRDGVRGQEASRGQGQRSRGPPSDGAGVPALHAVGNHSESLRQQHCTPSGCCSSVKSLPFRSGPVP